MEQVTRAIIGGTGVYDAQASKLKSVRVQTDFGAVELDVGEFAGVKVAFLARHGKDHCTPPHRINYRSNMKALQKLGVRFVYAVAAVGSCHRSYRVGDLVLPDDFIDFTSGRVSSYYDDVGSVAHVRMESPYCNYLQTKLKQVAKELTFTEGVVYGCTQGPRFETASEIRAYTKMGADVIGMTGVPEVCLAKELGMCYASVGVVTNMCSGVQAEIFHDEIVSSMAQNKAKLIEAFGKVFALYLNQDECSCRNSLIFL